MHGTDRATYDIVDSRGAILKQPQSSVELHIPSKAVPKNSNFTIKAFDSYQFEAVYETHQFSG